MLQSVQEGLLVNKDGKGDRSGTLPPAPLEDICAYFIGSHPRLSDARIEMRERFQKRYGSGAGESSHDVHWLFKAVYAREAIPSELLAGVTCPILIVRGADDTVCCPLEACEQWARSVFPP